MKAHPEEGGVVCTDGAEHAARLLHATEFLRTKDPSLALIIEQIGPCMLPPAGSTSALHALAFHIVGQQLSLRATHALFERLLARLRACLRWEGSRATSLQDFPSAEGLLAIPVEVFREAGLSGMKTGALRELCTWVASGWLDLDELAWLEDEFVEQRLTIIRGVGSWTARMFLLFHLARLDVWAPNDLALRNALARVWRLPNVPSPGEILAFGDLFRPYRSVASWYLWRHLDTVSP
jgi:DNA-3-methyladenine glycosylase II